MQITNLYNKEGSLEDARPKSHTRDYHRRISHLGSLSKGARRNNLWTLNHTMSTKMPIHPLLKHLWDIDHIQAEIVNAMKALFEIVKANVTGLAYDHLVNHLTWKRIHDFEFNLSMGRCTLRTPGFKPPGYLDCFRNRYRVRGL